MKRKADLPMTNIDILSSKRLYSRDLKYQKIFSNFFDGQEYWREEYERAEDSFPWFAYWNRSSAITLLVMENSRKASKLEKLPINEPD